MSKDPKIEQLEKNIEAQIEELTNPLKKSLFRHHTFFHQDKFIQQIKLGFHSDLVKSVEALNEKYKQQPKGERQKLKDSFKEILDAAEAPKGVKY